MVLGGLIVLGLLLFIFSIIYILNSPIFFESSLLQIVKESTKGLIETNIEDGKVDIVIEEVGSSTQTNVSTLTPQMEWNGIIIYFIDPFLLLTTVFPLSHYFFPKTW